MRKPCYRELRILMAKHGLTQNDISKISGLSLPSVSNKFAKGEEFKITPAYRILKYFREKGENVDFENLFCEEIQLTEECSESIFCLSGN